MTDKWGNKIKDADGNSIDTREYLYTRFGKESVIIQDHSAGHQYGQGGIGDQGPHFNVRPESINKRRNGHVPGTNAHYPFKTRTQ